MIPMVMRLAIREPKEEGGTRINLWLPLFLLWILLLPFFVLAILAWAVLKLFSAVSPGCLKGTRLVEAAAVVLWKIDGLRVDVRSRESRFILHF